MYKKNTASVVCRSKLRLLYRPEIIMRLFVVLFITSMHVSVMASAQKITMHRNYAPLSEVIRELKKQSGYYFLFDAQAIRNAPKVSIAVREVSLQEALDQCLEGLPLTYTIEENSVIISKTMIGSVSQTDVVTGKITNEKGEALEGVTVRLKQLQRGVVSDAAGNYRIRIAGGQPVLVFSMVGYAAQERPVRSGAVLNIVLQEQADDLSEVVVVGYGTQKKVNLTGSVSTVAGEDLAKRPVHRASMALQGMAPGVTVVQASGRPGGDQGTIRIRGMGSLETAGAAGSAPLVLVDGVQSNLDGVDQNDIASISVLKDAASAAIYGSRAANGVILVTTKSGRNEQLRMDYNGYVGRQVFTTTPEFVDGYTYITKLNEAYANMNRSPIYSEQFVADYLRYKHIDPDRYPDTDWQKELYTGSGMTQHHHVSVTGGGRVNTMGSFSYQDQQGIIPNFRQKRYSFRLNAQMDIRDNLQSQVFITGRTAPTYQPTQSALVMSAVNRLAPVIPARLSDGKWGVGSNGNNPVAQAHEGGVNYYDYDQLRATFQLNYQPFSGADVEFHFTPEYTGSNRRHFNRSIDTYEPGMETPAYTIPARSLFVRANVRTWERTMRMIGRYQKQLEAHQFSFLGGYEQIGYRTDNFDARREGYPSPDYQELDAGSIENWQNSGTGAEWSLQSWFGRLNYDFKERYLFEANMRIDGSSRFPEQNKFGVFPSFSAGWRLSEEAFIKPVTWLSDLKLRASWGSLGNQNIGNYPFSAVMVFGPSFSFGGAPADGANQRIMANTSISWESTETGNIGVDVAVLNNRLSATMEYYIRRTTGILLELPVPAIIGLDPPFQNAGVVRNQGWDMSVNYRSGGTAFQYQVGLNLSDVRNEVVDLRGAGPIIDGFRLTEEGYPINTLFGYRATGIFQNQEQVNSSPIQSFTNYGPGDIIYADINGDGVVNTEDRTSIGNEIPRYTFGLNFSAQYSGFDLSLLLQGVGEQHTLFTGDAVWALYNNGKMQTWQLDAWTPENPEASHPRLIAESSHNNYQNSSFWVYSAAYARLKNLQIGYTIPEKVLGRLPVRRLRVYATGDNVFTLHRMPKGWDPETRSGNAQIYPIASNFLLGLNITF